jgi:RNA ligase
MSSSGSDEETSAGKTEQPPPGLSRAKLKRWKQREAQRAAYKGGGGEGGAAAEQGEEEGDSPSIFPPPELQIQAYLREASGKNTLEALERDYGIRANRHKTRPLVSLHYDQLTSDLNKELVRECRGIILDESNNWACVCLPYKKFFNAGELAAQRDVKAMDWGSTATCYEKVDGSLMILYAVATDDADSSADSSGGVGYEWQVASSGRPEAGGKLRRDRVVGGSDEEDGCETLADLFWDVFRKKGYNLPPAATHHHYCFMWELMSRRSVIHIVPSEDLLLLHGARDMRTHAELRPEPLCSELGWECVRTCGKPTSVEEVSEWAKGLDVALHEGYVVCDDAFNRVKIKSPAYVALSLLQRRDADGLNVRRMCTIVMANEGEEFCAYFPHWAYLYSDVKARFDALVDELEATWARLSIPKLSNKDFSAALRAEGVDPTRASAFWALQLEKAPSVRQYMSKMDPKSLEKLITRGDRQSIRTKDRMHEDANDET